MSLQSAILRAVYVGTVTVLIPIGIPVAFVGSLLRPRWRAGLAQRLTLQLPSGDGRSLWLHAASAGEVKVAAGLTVHLSRALPSHRVVLTTNTVAGVAGAAARGMRAHYAPLDFPLCVGRFLDAVKPSALLIVETELWPCYVRGAAARGIPVILVNGRISDRSMHRYRIVRPLLSETLRSFRALLMRGEIDAARARDLGADPARVRVMGDLKAVLQEPKSRPASLRGRYGFSDRDIVVVAGSTDEGEERIVLDACRPLLASVPSLRLVIAPRQPDRFDSAWEIVQRADPAARRASHGSVTSAPPRTILLDSMGELDAHYADADVAFVGGSFTTRGGQNMMEPALHACPVLYGPHVANWQECAEALESAGGAYRCASPADLAARLADLVGRPEARRTMGDAARRAVAPLLDVAERTAREVVSLLGLDPAIAIPPAHPPGGSQGAQ